MKSASLMAPLYSVQPAQCYETALSLYVGSGPSLFSVIKERDSFFLLQHHFVL